jgi:hypothetical protein
MLHTADTIRALAGRYVQEGRRRGDSEVTIVAGQLVRELHLNNRVPAVCSALASKRFLTDNGLELEKKEGPPSGMSTTTRFTYRFVGALSNEPTRSEKFLALRGAGKEAFKTLGGGDTYLRTERTEFGTL